MPGQHLDIRLTAADGYQAQRSYSIATPSDGPSLSITVEHIRGGEVSPYLVNDVGIEDMINRDELGAIAAREAGVELLQTLTRSRPPGWDGGTRRVDRDMLAGLA
jgi:hypothetical protein